VLRFDQRTANSITRDFAGTQPALISPMRTKRATGALPGIILLLYLPAFCGSLTSRGLADIYIATVGGMCYPIYLLHNCLIALFGPATGGLGQTLPFEVRLAIQTLVMTPVVLTLSIVYCRAVEQPCMRPDWPARLRHFP
jgi:peptidoglycan/LPS O-acetylase OafA/YrhL